jgi:hypothetical protein
MKRDIEREALDHALAALDDGSGHDVWGPGPIGAKLWQKRHKRAALAFDIAAQDAVHAGKLGRSAMTAFMRKVAPAVYEALSDG